MFRTTLQLLLMLTALGLHAEEKPLEVFYGQLDQAVAVLKSQADRDAQQAHLMASEAQKGLELFGNFSAGYQKSPFAKEPFGRFFNPLARIGIRYPLLGSAEQQQRTINDASTQVEIEDIRLDWSKRLALLFMEENYAAYWSAQNLLTLNQLYLQLRANGVEKKLLERREAGLLLASDYYEFISAFEQAERSTIEFESNLKLALKRLSHLTNQAVAPFSAIKPHLAEIEHHASVNIEQLDLAILQARIDNLQHTRETEKWQGIDSDISATVFGGPAIPHPSPDGMQFGYGGAVGLNIRMPLGIIEYRKQERSRVNSQLHSLHVEYRQRDQELSLEFDALLGQYHRMTQQINFQHTRLNAARESVRERYLRLQHLDGDVLEKYLQAVNQYYRSAVELLETVTEHWKFHIRLRQFITVTDKTSENEFVKLNVETVIKPLKQARERLSNESSKDLNGTVSTQLSSVYPSIKPEYISTKSIYYGVYLWNYDEVRRYSKFWDQSRSLGINRILLSLNHQEINSVAADASELQEIISKAHRYGIKVELLLGDPDWILPEKRGDLLQIIESLQYIDFDGLHLDIEPDQLKSDLSRDALQKAFVETVSQATAASFWPVGISIHPRYLKTQPTSLCIPCEFSEANVREITVMYYSMNIDRIVETLKSAMHEFPGMVFSLAQSVERELGPENSYAIKPKTIFKQAMQKLHHALQSANFGGLIIQSWEEWKSYQHENSL